MKSLASIFLYLIVAIAIAAVGVGTGWHMAKQKDSGGGGGHGHAHGSDGGGHAHGEAAAVSAQALANLGVNTQAATKTSWQRYAPVPAVVRETPLTERHIVAAVGGRVLSIDVELGQLVSPGQAVVRILREPLPRAALGLTQGVLTPATEEYHQAKSDLRKALKSNEILEQELKRLGGFDGASSGLPLVPRQNLINLRYEQAKVIQDIANLRQELRLHGISDSELTEIESGGDVALNPRVWKALLQRNGLWSAQADTLLAALPDAEQIKPWSVALVAELALQQLAAEELLTWLGETPAAAAEFATVAGLLQGGASVTQVRDLFDLGAFSAEVSVLVPAGAEDWDVHAVAVAPGDMVSAGDDLLSIANPRSLRLVAHPAGGETAALLAALRSSQTVSAKPLVAGSGPDLADLTLLTVTANADDEPVAYLTVENSELRNLEREGRTYRSWNLRPGLRYMLRVPTEQLDDVVVLPVGAIVQDGAETQVFVRNGSDFLPAKVVLAYRDHEVVVLGKKSEIFPGDEVVVSNAFALKLALNAGDGGADAHHGHAH
jgi:multidrug efflux pump subunit AcrA (membrane-fusion protein)